MRTRNIIAWIVGIAIFVWIGRALYLNWHKIAFEELEFNYVFLILSALFHICGFILMSITWKYTMLFLGQNIGFMHSLEILSLTRLGRYLPGKVWFAMGRAYFAKAKGIPQRTVYVSIVLEVILQFWAAVLLFFATGAPAFGKGININPYILGAVLIASLVLMHPAVFNRLINVVLRRLKRQTIDFSLTIPRILVLLVMFFFIFAFHGCGFLFLIRSFYPLALTEFPVMVSIFAVAWVIGFISFITPAGLGVREGALSLLLTNHVPTGIGIIAALLSRIWLTIIEVLLFLLFVPKLKRYL
ncbi:hypothetical protein AMJ87_13145 [candidate division WOR_3 bacterium SM23_60]|uniref:Lysylphosphatidylglycerol synthetase n=1 Tax=candidate division WOR_3 bacterium SM23_60 TaxID=1703780 RepID=A0A0S8G456_UNCW3|nr:MAG: hypothetical protein AMJ87_13145 [candidate division WOR_3 bacterium SM23_60]